MIRRNHGWVEILRDKIFSRAERDGLSLMTMSRILRELFRSSVPYVYRVGYEEFVATHFCSPRIPSYYSHIVSSKACCGDNCGRIGQIGDREEVGFVNERFPDLSKTEE